MSPYSMERSGSMKIRVENLKNERKTRRFFWILVNLSLISLLIITPITFFSAVETETEPYLLTILSNLGFTNVTFTETQTFPPGNYNITLHAEIASYYYTNELSYYPVNTSDFQVLFTGPEGILGNYREGYVDPPISKSFAVDSQFGLSLATTEAATEYRYFTEHWLNPDIPEHHALVYINLDYPNMFLIGFEDLFGGGDRDYADMVVSLVPISLPEIINVTRTPETPNYDQSVKVAAQVIKKEADIESVILNYQTDSANGINITMSLEEGKYVAEIPKQPYNTTVDYKVYAFDNRGYYSASELFSYSVGDFVAPAISNVLQTPNSPNPAQVVKISANVMEPQEASGVKNVTLWHRTNNAWSLRDMTTQNELWTANIPGQGQGVNVEYFIEAFDNAGNKATTSTRHYTVMIPNRPPIALFSESASTVFTGQVIEFNASNSYDLDGIIVSYLWDFGDGTTASGVNATHAYSEIGIYTVTLTVTDNNGATNSVTAMKIVNNRPPVAVFTESATIAYVNDTITFNAAGSYDSDGTIVDYSWNFGDGTKAKGVTVSHAYADDGSYAVTLIVTDDKGATNSTHATKTIFNRKPVASFTETAETVQTGETISFDASESHDPDGFIISHLWDFGDGNTAVGVEVDHAYEDDGIYTVTLTVIDNDGASGSATSTRSVLNSPPIASFTENATTVKKGEVIHFDASASYDPDGSIVSYHWNFGDNTTITGVISDHAYNKDGTYTVTLTITDDDGASTSENAVKTVETETMNGALSLSVLAPIGLGVAVLTGTIIYGLIIRRKRKNRKL